MSGKRFLLIIFSNFLVLFIGYISLFYFQLGAKPLKAEVWIDDVYEVKDKKANNINGKKLIIISGSNSLFGINSETISNITNLPVLNLAVHASLDIDYLYYKIKKYIGEEDIVVMPLEYGHYKRDGYSKWFINNILVWENNYYYNLNPIDKLKFISSVNPKRLLLGVKAKLDNQLYIKNKNVNKELNQTIEKDGIKWRGYNFKSCNYDGDINADEYNVAKNNGSYLNPNYSHLSEHFISTYNKIKELVDEYNGKLILTHPVTFKNNKYDLTKQIHQNEINQLVNTLKSEFNLSIECNPLLFHLEKQYAFNTNYHPNKFGALIRSENLAYCINRVLNNDLMLSNDDAIVKTNNLEKKYISIVKKAPMDHFIQRKQDLEKVKNALITFYKDNGYYPKSNGYDGIYSKWGDSKVEWISGLIPKFIKKLPKDPRNTKDPTKQYIYKSNGKDYKLISHSPEDCKKVKDNNYNMIDPKRDCWAYGFWTKGAENW